MSLHVWLALWLLLTGAFLWGDLAERSYVWRMRSRWRRRYLMPGRWSHRIFYVRWTRRLGGAALVFGLLVYGVALASLLS